MTTNRNLTIKLIKLLLYALCILFLRDLYLYFYRPLPSRPSSPSPTSALAAPSSSLNSSSSTSSTFCYVICSLSCIVLKKIRHFSSYFFTSSRSMSMKCLSSSSLFLSTLVATGNIRHKEMNREHEATMSR